MSLKRIRLQWCVWVKRRSDGCIAQTSLLLFSELITPWPDFSGEAVALGLWAWRGAVRGGARRIARDGELKPFNLLPAIWRYESLFVISMENIKDTVHV